LLPARARARARSIDRFQRAGRTRSQTREDSPKADLPLFCCIVPEEGRRSRRGERLCFLGWTSLDEYASPSAMRIAGPPLILALLAILAGGRDEFLLS